MIVVNYRHAQTLPLVGPECRCGVQGANIYKKDVALKTGCFYKGAHYTMSTNWALNELCVHETYPVALQNANRTRRECKQDKRKGRRSEVLLVVMLLTLYWCWVTNV